jgi:hypothetical protein
MKPLAIILAAAAAIALSAGTALAFDLAVAGFYSPGFVMGEAAGGSELSPAGFKGQLSVGVYRGLAVAVGFGYNDFVYREEGFHIPEYAPVLSLPMLITTVGADYAFPISFLRPYFGGGAVFARETAEAFGYTTVDWYGGLYAEGGARYFIGEKWAVEAGPRYTLLFDEPVVAYDDWELRDFERSENRSQLLEFLFGVSYHF